MSTIRTFVNADVHTFIVFRSIKLQVAHDLTTTNIVFSLKSNNFFQIQKTFLTLPITHGLKFHTNVRFSFHEDVLSGVLNFVAMKTVAFQIFGLTSEMSFIFADSSLFCQNLLSLSSNSTFSKKTQSVLKPIEKVNESSDLREVVQSFPDKHALPVTVVQCSAQRAAC